jgi:hypothetical protein
MISELNQPARIASLECGLVKIPACRRWRPDRHILFSFFFRFFPITFVENNPLARSADALVLIWDIDLTLAWALSRNVRRTDASLKASDDKTASTSGLLDLHASGREELTAGRLNCKKNRQ